MDLQLASQLSHLGSSLTNWLVQPPYPCLSISVCLFPSHISAMPNDLSLETYSFSLRAEGLGGKGVCHGRGIASYSAQLESLVPV